MNRIFKNIILITAYYILIVATLSSCKKFVEIDLPIDQVQTKTVFSNPETANAAIVGLYLQLQTTNLTLTNGGITIYAGLSADELKNTSASTDLDPFYNNSIPVNNNTGIYSRLWSAAYKYIYHANLIIEGLSVSETLEKQVKLSIQAEARFIRAFLYHYLVNMFGDVPLILTTDYRTNAALPRTAVEYVRTQILEDLLFAYEHLSQEPTSNNARPCKYTVAAFLSRVYLFEKNWTKAAEMASAVINSGYYQLETNLSNVYLLGSKETIWQLPKDAGNTTEGTTFMPTAASTSRPAYEIAASLMQAFEPQDKRLTFWINSKTVGGQIYFYPYKYKQRAATPLSEGYIVLRLAEQYLIRAEANLFLNNPDSAKTDLNAVRQRAGVSKLDNSSIDLLYKATIAENRKEFFAEWGHRWFLLKRTGIINEILSLEKPNWKPSAALFPIPFTEILRNPFLTQNPEY